MKLTDRDIRLLKDMALSHALTRDQLIRLGYFTSVSRCNRTLRRLLDGGLIRPVKTPFRFQGIYSVKAQASDFVGERIGQILSGRQPTPRFLQHALAITETRIALLTSGGTGWRFELQLRHEFSWAGRKYEVRPDGMIFLDGNPVLLEIDLGNAPAKKIMEKLKAYGAYRESGLLKSTYGSDSVRVVVVTTGNVRRQRLATLDSKGSTIEFTTFSVLNVEMPGGWS